MAGAISEVQKVILKISKQLKLEDVDAIKFFYEDQIGAGVLEDHKNALSLLRLLKERDELSDMVKIKSFCQNVLDEIGRSDITESIFGNSEGSSSSKFQTHINFYCCCLLNIVDNSLNSNRKDFCKFVQMSTLHVRLLTFKCQALFRKIRFSCM